jgi:hypothetical protein
MTGQRYPRHSQLIIFNGPGKPIRKTACYYQGEWRRDMFGQTCYSFLELVGSQPNPISSSALEYQRSFVKLALSRHQFA